MTIEWYKFPGARLSEVGVTTEEGLTGQLRDVWRNTAPMNSRRNPAGRGWRSSGEQFANIPTVLLILAAVVSMVLGDWIEAAAAILVIVIQRRAGLHPGVSRRAVDIALKKNVGAHRARGATAAWRRFPRASWCRGDVGRWRQAIFCPPTVRAIQSVNSRRRGSGPSPANQSW